MMSGAWYHGSPLMLTILRRGSTITQNRDLARAFSHKPTILVITDEGRIQHSGTMPGFLYQIDQEIRPGDVEPHPRTTMDPGLEWLTTRDLSLSLIGPAELTDSERLTEDEIDALRKRMQNP
jgi:hypothetical protein